MMEVGKRRDRMGCFSFLPTRRLSGRKKKPTAPRPAPVVPVPAEVVVHGTSTSEEEGSSSGSGACESPKRSGLQTLDTFAYCRAERRQSRERTTPGAAACRVEKLVIVPYFGTFAGHRLTFRFDRKKSDSQVNVRVKVDGSDQVLTTLREPKRSESARTLRDRCLNFAHDIRATSPKHFRTGPPSLAFLCEQTVLLHSSDLPVSQLPAHRFDFLFQARTQDVRVRVWPKGFVDSFHLKVKPNLSVAEFQWMLCKRLSLPNPTCFSVYEKDSLESFSHTHLHSLQPHQLELECILSPRKLQRSLGQTLEVGKSLQVTVSVIGQGIDDVKVHPSMTLCEFEQAIKRTFSLGERSFLYMPQVFRSRKSSQCGLTMTTLLDDSTACLITPDYRNFPMVVGIPSLKIEDSYKQLPLYQTAISELDLLKATPVIVFEVSGPTVPLAFKTIRAQGYTEDLSCFNPRDSVFALVSVRPHVVSVNPDWTMETLLKFIESISGFPCENVKIGRRTLDSSDTVSTHFVKQWLSVTTNGRVHVDVEIPEVATL